jgi:hypothetical protein
MDLTYIARGADGKQYGPASLDQLNTWIEQGRLQAQQAVKRSDMGHWAAAAEFAELQPAFGIVSDADSPGAALASEKVANPQDPATVRRMKSGASWFYWIAGLSLINSIAALSGRGWRFIVGLGITQNIDEFANRITSGGKIIAFALDLLVAGVFVLCGLFAHKAQTWAFLAGMALFALDGVIFLLAKDWLGVGFHLLLMYWLFGGFAACRTLDAKKS